MSLSVYLVVFADGRGVWRLEGTLSGTISGGCMYIIGFVLFDSRVSCKIRSNIFVVIDSFVLSCRIRSFGSRHALVAENVNNVEMS